MVTITTPPLPEDSLLARLRPDCYRDAFATETSREISLQQFIAAFYSAASFTPERKLLSLIGRGASHADIAALAQSRADTFAAWHVEAREEAQILLRDFRDQTCSWLAIEPISNGTKLWFGSGVRHPDKPLVSALMPFHRWYSRVLLAGAARRLNSR